MFSQWCKIVTTNPERHFILKFETLSAGGYRLLMTDFERLWMEEVSTAESLSRILKVKIVLAVLFLSNRYFSRKERVHLKSKLMILLPFCKQ